ncbi:MAG: LytTR family DNA-binding domain-containing protein [Bacteroidota bacterium]
MKACIVDDEKKGRDSLQTLLEQYCSEVEVVGQADSVENAYQFILKNKPELVFLDVEMPQGSGFELLKKFDRISFKTIFVTAHQHYAIKAIRFSAIDYLLKPVDVDELVAAVQNAVQSDRQNQQQQYTGLLENLEHAGPNKIAIPVKDGVTFIDPCDIIRLQADGTYTHIFTGTGKYTASRNIKEYEELLSDQFFFRAHNSHLINLKHVRHFSRVDGYFVQMSDGSTVEVARRRKDEFLALMNK